MWLALHAPERVDRLVLAAGSFGSTYLLLKNRAAFPGLSERLGLRSDASGRWEKGIDPYAAEQAAVYASELLVSLTGSRLTGHVDVHGTLPARPVKASRMLPIFRAVTDSFVQMGADAAASRGEEVACEVHDTGDVALRAQHGKATGQAAAPADARERAAQLVLRRLSAIAHLVGALDEGGRLIALSDQPLRFGNRLISLTTILCCA